MKHNELKYIIIQIYKYIKLETDWMNKNISLKTFIQKLYELEELCLTSGITEYTVKKS